jgi:hypothetical protein
MWIVLLTSTPRLLNIELETCNIPYPPTSTLNSKVTTVTTAVYDSLDSIEEDVVFLELSQEDLNHSILAINLASLETIDISHLFQKVNHGTLPPTTSSPSADTDC